jgi:response regulator NasT
VNALIVSNTENSVAYLTETLKSIACKNIVTAYTCKQAASLFIEQDYDICVINSPLPDASGESLSVKLASQGFCQVILIVRKEYYDEITAHVEDSGVIAVVKPINRETMRNALKLAKAAHTTVKKLHDENTKLIKRIEDIQLINRAKLVLISHLSMSEAEAHQFIEKQAMNTRETKRTIAEGILRTYEY